MSRRLQQCACQQARWEPVWGPAGGTTRSLTGPPAGCLTPRDRGAPPTLRPAGPGVAPPISTALQFRIRATRLNSGRLLSDSYGDGLRKGVNTRHDRLLSRCVLVRRRFFALNTEFPLATRQRLLLHGVAASRAQAGGRRRRRRRSGGSAVGTREVFVVRRIRHSTTQRDVDVFAPLLLLLLKQTVILRCACKPCHRILNLVAANRTSYTAIILV